MLQIEENGDSDIMEGGERFSHRVLLMNSKGVFLVHSFSSFFLPRTLTTRTLSQYTQLCFTNILKWTVYRSPTIVTDDGSMFLSQSSGPEVFQRSFLFIRYKPFEYQLDKSQGQNGYQKSWVVVINVIDEPTSNCSH